MYIALLLYNHAEIIAACREAIRIVMDIEKLERHIDKPETQCEELSTLIRTHINSNANEAKEQVEYAQKYNELASRLGAATKQRKKAEREMSDRQRRCAEVQAYLNALDECVDIVTEFDGYLRNIVIDVVTIQPDNSMVFRLKDGCEMVWR